MTLKKIIRSISVAALFLIPVFPLIVANSFFFPFITGKAFYFRILVEVAFAGWLLLALLDAKYRPKLNALLVGISLFALVTLVADLLGVSPLRSLWSNFERMEGWITIVHLWAFFIAATGMFGAGEEGKRLWHRWFNFELVVGLAVGFYGVFQLFGWTAIHEGSSRIDASLGNAAYMAVYMLMNAGLAVYMYFVARAKQIANAGFLVWAYPIMAIFFSFLLFETATRGTILGLVGGIMAACFLYAVLGKNEKRSNRWYAIGVIVLFVAIAGGLYGAKDTNFVKSHDVLNRLASISWSDAQGQARNIIWPMAIKGWSQRPIFGWGQENFNYIFNANYNPVMWNQEQWFDRAHSVFLDWLTASGLVGLFSYLSLYVLFLLCVWKSSLSLAEKSVLTGLLAGYAVHNVFVFDNLASYVLFFSAMGFVSSLKEGKPLRWLGSATMSAESIEYIAGPIVIIALVGVVWFFDVRPIQANTDLIAALTVCGGQGSDAALFQNALNVNVYVANQEIREQLLSCGGRIITNQQMPGPTRQAFLALASQAIDDQIAATPTKDARIYTLGGSFMDEIGQFAPSVTLLGTAHELSPGKQSISIELANGLINTGKYDDAVKLLAPTYQSATDDTQAATAYALALVIDGQEAKAHEIFGNDPAVFETSNMAQAYMAIKEYPKALEIYRSALAVATTSVDAAVKLAQAQYQAGMIAASAATLRGLEKAHPEYASQIEASIKQMQAGK